MSAARPAATALRLLAPALLLVTAAYILLSFRAHGISNDEEVQHVYGRLLLDYYTSGLSDLRAFAYKNLYLYGGLFDLVAAALERVLPLAPGPWVWDLRHLLSAAFGLLGLAGTWRLGRLLGGEAVGVLAALLLVLTGAWLGAMFTHTKDIPFAATMVWAVYFTARMLPRLPRPAWRDVVGLGIAVGGAFGLRVGAVFAVFYLVVGVLAAALLLAARGTRLAFVARAALALLPAGLIAVVLMGLFWPWAVMAPGNLVRAMTAFSHFSFELHTVLAGEVMTIGEVPGHYLLFYLLVRLPELFLLGLAAALLLALRWPARARQGLERGGADVLPWLPVVLAALFPLAYTLVAAPPLYNGLRHFTFLLPPLAVLAAAGLVLSWRRAAAWPRLRGLGAGLCGVLALTHGVTLARLHPYEYVAYNAFVDSLPAERSGWEKDYWASSLREAAAQLSAYVAREPAPTRKYTVALCAEALQGDEWLDTRFEVTRDWWRADFFISPTHMDCHNALQGAVIAEVVRDDILLAVVRDRRALVGEARRPR